MRIPRPFLVAHLPLALVNLTKARIGGPGQGFAARLAANLHSERTFCNQQHHTCHHKHLRPSIVATYNTEAKAAVLFTMKRSFKPCSDGIERKLFCRLRREPEFLLQGPETSKVAQVAGCKRCFGPGEAKVSQESLAPHLNPALHRCNSLLKKAFFL